MLIALNYADSLEDGESGKGIEEKKNTHKVHRKLLVIYEEHSSFENICECLTNMSVKMHMHKYAERMRGRERGVGMNTNMSASVNKR